MGPDVSTHQATARGWTAAAGILVLGGVALLAAGPKRWLGVALMLTGGLVAQFAVIRVVADSTGLQVAYGPFKFPRTRVTIDRIARASAIDVRPMRWGGWGYRGSLTVGRRAAVVVRGGPGLRLDLTNGKVFVVTIDDPQRAADVLNAAIRPYPTLDRNPT